MHWLTISARQVLDLAANQSLLRSLGVLARFLQAGNQISGEGGLFEVLERVAENRGNLDAVLSELARLQPSDGPVEADWRKLFLLLDGRVPDGYRILGCSLSDLESGRCGEGRRQLTWTPIDRSLDGSRADLADLRVDLGAAASRELVAEVASSLPDEVPSPGVRSSLRIGLRGAARASAAVGIPVRIGSIGVEGSGATGIVLDYYLAGEGNALLAEALSEGLTRLTTPFDLDALSGTLSTGRLLGITSEAQGALDLGGSIGVGRSLDLIRGIGAEVGLRASFKTKREGRFLFTIRGDRDDADPRAVLVDLARTGGKTETDALVLGLRLDLSGVRDHLPRLLKLTDEAQRILAKFDALLPPSGVVAGLLRKELGQGLSGGEPERRIADALGVSFGTDAPELVDLIQSRLAQQIDATAGIWEGAASESAAFVIGRVCDELGLDPDGRGLLEALIERPLLDAIDLLQFEFRTKIRRLAGGNETTSSLKAELQGAQRLLSKVSGAIRQSAEVKLQARLHREERRSRSRSVRMSLRFHPGIPGAQDSFERLMTGSVEESLAAARQQGAGGPVEVLNSESMQTTGIERESGFELALLDLPLSRTSFLDADVAVETDQAGNIQVHASTESATEGRSIGEVRTLRMVNVFELATAGTTRRMTFAVSLSHREEHFDDDEVLSFFEALELEKLVPAATGAKTLERLDEHTSGDRDAKRRGELRVWLDLEEDELLRMLQLERDGDGFRPGGFDAGVVYRTAVAAIVRGHELTGSNGVMNNLAHFIRTQDLASDVESFLLKIRNSPRRAGVGFGDDSAELGKLERMSDNANGLAEALETMRAVYLSPKDAARGPWTEQDYLNSQTLIDRKMQAWMRGELLDKGILGSFTSEALRPYTLAYFKTVAVLSKGLEESPPLAASLYLDAEPVGRDMRLI